MLANLLNLSEIEYTDKKIGSYRSKMHKAERRISHEESNDP